MLLDMSAGSRIANPSYPEKLKRLDLLVGPAGDGRVRGFRLVRRRARDAPGDVVPGLFGSTLQHHAERIGYVGVSGFEQTEAVVAANRRGHVERASMGTIGTFAARAVRMWNQTDVLVARFPNDASGLAALDGILPARRPGDLILIVRAPPAGTLRLLPSGMLGPGAKGGVLYSPTTRRLGLVAATDYAPTVLHHLGIPIPNKMQGRVIESRHDGDPESVRSRMARLDVLLGRRPVATNFWFFAFCAMMLVLGLARGSPLIGASLAGPNPKGGARFFGVGNELEILLSLEVLFGLGALLSAVKRSRHVQWGFAGGCLVAAAIIGSGRLGADVGGVITLGAGGAVAVLASLGRPPSRRSLAIAVLVPFVAVAGLIGLDLLTSGGAHLTRSVVHGNGVGDLLDIVKRRLIISVTGLERVTTAITCGLGIIAFYLGVRRRREIFAQLRDQPAFMAGIWGAFAATVVGTLANDSGPLIFEAGFIMLLLATGYSRARPAPGRPAPAPTAQTSRDSSVAAGAVG
jgi:hypothetical protein